MSQRNQSNYMCLSEDHIIEIKLFLKELFLTKQTIIFNLRFQTKRSGIEVFFYMFKFNLVIIYHFSQFFLFTTQCLTWEYLDLFKFTDVDVIIAVPSKFQVWLCRLWRETPTLDHSAFICLTCINNVFTKVQMPPSSLQSRKIKTPSAIWLPLNSVKRF